MFFSKPPTPKPPAMFHPDDQRIMAALKWEEKPFRINPLTLETLQVVANTTSNVRLHYSGNCVVLANTVLYNLKRGQVELSVGNTASPFKGVNEIATNKAIFQGVLDPMSRKKDSNAATLSQDILNSFKTRNERFFYIGLDYESPYLIGRMLNMGGHSLNAVVLGDGDAAQVVFLDAWYKKLYTPAEFEKKYPMQLSYTLEAYVGEVKPIVKPDIEAKSEVKLETKNMDIRPKQ